jgi:hypothetical protein
MEIVKNEVEETAVENTGVDLDLAQPEAGKELYNGVDFSALDAESFAKVKEIEGKLNALTANPEADEVLTEAERDAKFGEMQGLLKEYSEVIRAATFNIPLLKEEHEYLTKVITVQTEYSSETILTGMDIMNKYFTLLPRFKRSSVREVITFVSSDLLAIYMFILKHNVRGLGRNAKLFANLLVSMGIAVNIYNYFDMSAQTFDKKIANWAAGLEEKDTAEVTADETTA